MATGPVSKTARLQWLVGSIPTSSANKTARRRPAPLAVCRSLGHDSRHEFPRGRNANRRIDILHQEARPHFIYTGILKCHFSKGIENLTAQLYRQ